MELQDTVVRATRTVGAVARKIASKGKRFLLPPKDYVPYKGSWLPPRGLRFNGPDHEDEGFYLASAKDEASDS